jgi:hypothetical protein
MGTSGSIGSAFGGGRGGGGGGSGESLLCTDGLDDAIFVTTGVGRGVEVIEGFPGRGCATGLGFETVFGCCRQ